MRRPPSVCLLFHITICVLFYGSQGSRRGFLSCEPVHGFNRDIKRRITSRFGVDTIIIFKTIDIVVKILNNSDFIRCELFPAASVQIKLIMPGCKWAQVAGDNNNRQAVFIGSAGCLFVNPLECIAVVCKCVFVDGVNLLLYIPGLFIQTSRP